jgi:hypothetical protein
MDMFTIVLLLYLQLHLEVSLEGSSLRGVYRTAAECEDAAVKLRGALPTPRGHAAAWQDAVCLPIGRDVKVNELAPLDLGRLHQQWPPMDCGADGAWRRVAELCVPSGTGGARERKR